tara:strand:- start:1317 stop:1550 length:234 start_codon:yes stop_codon:yes gene_type:complete
MIDKSKAGYWGCPSIGPQNNGLLKECDFAFRFDFDFRSVAPNCPQCGTELVWNTAGKSVADILRQGMELEIQNKKKS